MALVHVAPTPIADAVRLAGWPDKPLHVTRRLCEINVQSATNARSLLCMFDTASYVGLAFDAPLPTNWTPTWVRVVRNAETLRNFSDDGRAHLLSGMSPSVDVATESKHVARGPAHLRPASCDLLLVNTDGWVDHRQSILTDLPATLRLANPSSIILIHGPARCSSERYKPSGRKKVLEQCWHDVWSELAAQGSLVETRCDTQGDRRWCAGKTGAQTSLCYRAKPLLTGRPLVVSGDETRVDTAMMRAWPLEFLTGLKKSWRYYSLVPCDAGYYCLLFKDSLFESWVGGVKLRWARDAVTIASEPELAFPAGVRGSSGQLGAWRAFPWGDNEPRATHNFHVTRLSNGTYVLVGGVFRGKDQHRGIWVATGASWRWSEHERCNLRQGLSSAKIAEPKPIAVPKQTQWRVRHMMSGWHPGCVDRRSNRSTLSGALPAGACEFDGRLTLVHFRGRFLLYSRANLASHGQRFVQVASSSDLHAWSPFRLLHIAGYHPSQGNLYYWAAQPNPVHEGSLLAWAPLVHRTRGCLMASVSTDGINWSALRPLLPCRAHGERTAFHPVAGGIVLDGDVVSFLVARNVPGVSFDSLTPAPLRMYRVKTEPFASLARWQLDAGTLRQWTMEALASLKQ